MLSCPNDSFRRCVLDAMHRNFTRGNALMTLIANSVHSNRRIHTHPYARQGGVSLIVVLLLLVIVSMLGIASMQIAMMGERGARNDRG